MTHEELLAKIDEHIDYGTCGVCDGKCYKEENIPWLALRAVVELHKPKQDPNFPSAIICSNCGVVPLPCSTIQAIEEQLK